MGGPGQRKYPEWFYRIGVVIDSIAWATGMSPGRVITIGALGSLLFMGAGTATTLLVFRSPAGQEAAAIDRSYQQRIDPHGPAAKMHRHRLTGAQRSSGMSYVGQGAGMSGPPAGLTHGGYGPVRGASARSRAASKGSFGGADTFED